MTSETPIKHTPTAGSPRPPKRARSSGHARLLNLSGYVGLARLRCRRRSPEENLLRDGNTARNYQAGTGY